MKGARVLPWRWGLFLVHEDGKARGDHSKPFHPFNIDMEGIGKEVPRQGILLQGVEGVTVKIEQGVHMFFLESSCHYQIKVLLYLYDKKNYLYSIQYRR